MSSRPNKPEIAIVGRPNVGKSTLFNRLVGRRLALVDPTPGVTRDRRAGEAVLGDLAFDLVDTAGFEDADAETLAGRMGAQTGMAIAGADLVLFVVDAQTGLTALDRQFAEIVRRSGRPVVVVANKSEGRAGAGVYEAYALGLGDPVAVSAEHNEGLADLHAAIRAALPEAWPDDDEAADEGSDDRPLSVAVVGRPNTGKSTLVNRMLGEERLLTGPEAGVTRDAISVDWSWQGRRFRLVDTAGLRRKARVQEKLERLSVADALHAMSFAETVIVLLDATMPFDKQDLQIADLVEREGRAAVIALNKWDLIEDRDAALAELREKAERLLPQLRGIPLVPVSGLTGAGVDRLLKAVVETYDTWNRRIPTAALNRWLAEAVERHAPPAVSGRRIRLRYMTQAKARPPTFVAFCSRPEALPDAYRRYLINGLRDSFDLNGVPIRLLLRKGDNPYAGRKR
jgi:GTP-binding protein